MSKITVLATFEAKPRMEERLREELLKLVAPTRSEEGCVDYILHQSDDNPSKFMFYENWKTKEDLFDIHLKKDYIKRIKSLSEELLVQPIEISTWTNICD